MNNQPRRDALAQVLESRLAARMDLRAGLVTDALLERLDRLVHGAKKVARTFRDGKEIERVEIEEPAVQLAALKEALALRAAYPAKQVALTGSVRVEQLHELSMRFEELPADQLAQIIEAESVALPPGDEAAQ